MEDALRSLGEGGLVNAKSSGVLSLMRYVYILQSLSHSEQRYIGTTVDLKERLKQHNRGHSPYTSKYKPWKIVIAVYFEDDKKAETFERYLKSGSGHAFAKRHF
jgi:putative endonuclease